MKTYSAILAGILAAPLSMLGDMAATNQAQDTQQEARQRDSKRTAHATIESKTLSEQVVTAAGYNQHIKEAPASISIMSKEDILTRPIRDIGDVVQDVPGVYVEQDKTGQNSISMRGLLSSS